MTLPPTSETLTCSEVLWEEGIGDVILGGLEERYSMEQGAYRVAQKPFRPQTYKKGSQ